MIVTSPELFSAVSCSSIARTLLRKTVRVDGRVACFKQTPRYSERRVRHTGEEKTGVEGGKLKVYILRSRVIT